jgi:voltage-gated potassium channel
MSGRDEARLGAWERTVEWPMAILAVVFLVVYATDVLAVSLSPSWHTALRLVDFVIWALFAAEFVVRVVLAHNHARYALRHVIDIVVLVLPFLRSLRVLRLVFLLRALNRWAMDSLRGRILTYGAGAAVLFIFCGGLAVLDAERGRSGANIQTFADSLWWAAVTIFTVGYGDRFPVTAEGRLVGVLLMASGVALVGAVTASFATWLIERVRVQEEADQTATRRDLHAVHAQLDRVEAEMAELKSLLRANQVVDRPASASS